MVRAFLLEEHPWIRTPRAWPQKPRLQIPPTKVPSSLAPFVICVSFFFYFSSAYPIQRFLLCFALLCFALLCFAPLPSPLFLFSPLSSLLSFSLFSFLSSLFSFQLKNSKIIFPPFFKSFVRSKAQSLLQGMNPSQLKVVVVCFEQWINSAGTLEKVSICKELLRINSTFPTLLGNSLPLVKYLTLTF